jgi:hypothetical protein
LRRPYAPGKDALEKSEPFKNATDSRALELELGVIIILRWGEGFLTCKWRGGRGNVHIRRNISTLAGS